MDQPNFGGSLLSVAHHEVYNKWWRWLQTQMVRALGRLLRAGCQSDVRRLLRRASLRLRQSALEDWTVPLQEAVHVRLTSVALQHLAGSDAPVDVTTVVTTSVVAFVTFYLSRLDITYCFMFCAHVWR